MTKEERAEISRRNGAKSKGPKTEEGRRRVADANTTHGVYRVSATVLDVESQESFEALKNDTYAHWVPRDTFEAQFVEELVDYTWRIRRLLLSATIDTNGAIERLQQRITAPIRAAAAISIVEVEASSPQGSQQMIQRRINALIANRAVILRELRAMKAARVLEVTQPSLQTKDLRSYQFPQSTPPTQPEPTEEPS
jgi:hypothetical protein